MATSFEKVMNACLEAKKPTTNTTAKKVVESKPTPKKAVAKKSLTEANRARRARKFYEDDDRDDIEFDRVNDIPSIPDVDEIDVDFDVINDTPVADDEMDDVADDVIVVVDPEIDAEEIDSIATELQDIVDDTPDGEVPTTDEYIGNYTYGCPICGTTFFSETELNDGDECPVCNETPTGFVLVGQVVSSEDAELADDADEIADDIEDFADDIDDSEELDVEEPVDDDVVDADEEEEKTAEESYRRARAQRMRREAMRRTPARRTATRRSSRARVESTRRNASPATRRTSTARKPARYTGMNLDESTFNPFLTKFIRENYKNAKSFTVKGAKLEKKSRTLRLECVITMKSGNSKKATLRVEGFNPNSRVMRAYDAGRTFKCESRSKVAPFNFKIRKVGNTIKCEGLRYNYTTKSLKEGKRYQVSGNLIRESRTPARRTASRPATRRYESARKPMSRTTATRRPATRRVSESRTPAMRKSPATRRAPVNGKRYK